VGIYYSRGAIDMLKYIEDRVLAVTETALQTNSTVRVLAKQFGVSKSTVYIDMTVRIKKLNPFKAKQVYKILMENKAERTIRGGQAKYLKSKKCV